MLHRGVPQPLDSRKVAVMLVIVMLLPIFTPVTADESVGRDDFGVLAAMAEALTEQRDSGEDELAHDSAEGILSALEARGREIGDGDALLATDGIRVLQHGFLPRDFSRLQPVVTTVHSLGCLIKSSVTELWCYQNMLTGVVISFTVQQFYDVVSILRFKYR